MEAPPGNPGQAVGLAAWPKLQEGHHHGWDSWLRLERQRRRQRGGKTRRRRDRRSNRRSKQREGARGRRRRRRRGPAKAHSYNSLIKGEPPGWPAKFLQAVCRGGLDSKGCMHRGTDKLAIEIQHIEQVMRVWQCSKLWVKAVHTASIERVNEASECNHPARAWGPLVQEPDIGRGLVRGPEVPALCQV